MEDDDEFGDLYTDVLTSFPSSSSSLSPAVAVAAATAATSSSQPPPPAVLPTYRPIDLNLQSEDTDDIPNSKFSTPSFQREKLDAVKNKDSILSNSVKRIENSDEETGEGDFKIWASAAGTRVLHNTDLNLPVKEQHKEEAEDAFGNEEEEEELPVIPGLNNNTLASAPKTEELSVAAAGDEWDSDSDSEDDLQIVLNETHHHAPIGMDANGMIDDEDEDGEPLVIVADDDAAGALQPLEDQDWGDEAAQSADAKDTTDSAKPNTGLQTAPKIGYSNFGYHPFHSQFKVSLHGAFVTITFYCNSIHCIVLCLYEIEIEIEIITSCIYVH